MSELLPCPLCRKPMEILENGSAWCRNLIENPDSYVEWAEASCLLACHSVILPTEVWQAVNEANTRTPSDAAHQVLTEMCETETRCRALLADYDKSSPDGIVPLDEVIALALSRSDAAVRAAAEEIANHDALGCTEHENPQDCYAAIITKHLPSEARAVDGDAREAVLRMALTAIAKDDDLECRCGVPPYTDGEPCPKCTAIQALDFDNAAAITATNKDSEV